MKLNLFQEDDLTTPERVVAIYSRFGRRPAALPNRNKGSRIYDFGQGIAGTISPRFQAEIISSYGRD
jgi:hypothetical protein